MRPNPLFAEEILNGKLHYFVEWTESKSETSVKSINTSDQRSQMFGNKTPRKKLNESKNTI